MLSPSLLMLSAALLSVPQMNEGDKVSVWIADANTAITKGARIAVGNGSEKLVREALGANATHVGNGIAQLSRAAMFASSDGKPLASGLAVVMRRRLYESPALGSDVLGKELVLQERRRHSAAPASSHSCQPRSSSR